MQDPGVTTEIGKRFNKKQLAYIGMMLWMGSGGGGAGDIDFDLLQESGDLLLQESGDAILQEN